MDPNNLFLLEAVASFIIGFLLSFVLKKGYDTILSKRGKPPMVKFMDYHIHHSLIGLILLLLWPILGHTFLVGAGFGIIAHHTYSEQTFAFIEKI